ncbi:hypothetical protein CDAR_409851 [Caerostris darwini]|uniref:Uncharacterized protein n=1 Tax=Caerostris darwini TaxID=1538125 RepID=A0AAV4U1L6_9ARAC|nr:hypothetical protein CDAR_409851 [Caerostris darwini]
MALRLAAPKNAVPPNRKNDCADASGKIMFSDSSENGKKELDSDSEDCDLPNKRFRVSLREFHEYTGLKDVCDGMMTWSS